MARRLTAQAAYQWVCDCNLWLPSDALHQLDTYGFEVHNGNDIVAYFAYDREAVDAIEAADAVGDEATLLEFLGRADHVDPVETIREVLVSLKDEDFFVEDDQE